MKKENISLFFFSLSRLSHFLSWLMRLTLTLIVLFTIHSYALSCFLIRFFPFLMARPVHLMTAIQIEVLHCISLPDNNLYMNTYTYNVIISLWVKIAVVVIIVGDYSPSRQKRQLAIDRKISYWRSLNIW